MGRFAVGWYKPGRRGLRGREGPCDVAVFRLLSQPLSSTSCLGEADPSRVSAAHPPGGAQSHTTCPRALLFRFDPLEDTAEDREQSGPTHRPAFLMLPSPPLHPILPFPCPPWSLHPILTHQSHPPASSGVSQGQTNRFKARRISQGRTTGASSVGFWL